MHRTGGYFARVETFEPFEGKKVIQLFGTDLSTVVRLADRPAPTFIINIITSIDTLVSDDLKGTRWWNGLVIDYATVYNVRQELNSLLRSDPAFFNPVGGVMKKEDRKRFETKISGSILNAEHLDELIEQNYNTLVFQDPPGIPAVKLASLLTLLSTYFKQLPESLIPGKYIPNINSLYLSKEVAPSLLFDAVISKLGENISTLQCLVLLWDTIIVTTADIQKNDEIYLFIADIFMQSILHPDLDDDTAPTVTQLDPTVAVRLVKDFIAVKDKISQMTAAILKSHKKDDRKKKNRLHRKVSRGNRKSVGSLQTSIPSPTEKNDVIAEQAAGATA
ncbi:unnamed protein product [Ambrosiozyma monospora]|uniref:Unnamed protein product n=1 Tax=Ambrosiozyma monospora TaxID=43982 RepID=A0A9W6SW04_AMBMO|nr:unnamed protein product [Ambrosiozyma monospora]